MFLVSPLPHHLADKVEVCDNRVAVCRDHANGICGRQKCKYYHIPIIVPPAPVMAAILHQHTDPPPGTEDEYQQREHYQPTTLDRGTVGAVGTRGLDAIMGTCTNSITTSEFAMLDVVTPATTTTTKAAVTPSSETSPEGGAAVGVLSSSL